MGMKRDLNELFFIRITNKVVVDVPIRPGQSGSPIIVEGKDGKLRIIGVACFCFRATTTLGSLMTR